MLIESDRSYAALLKAAFSKAKIHNRLDVATDAHEAVAYLNAARSQNEEPHGPALIILALTSQFDCSTMVRWLRRQPQLLHVPCVVFGSEGPSSKKRAPRKLVCDHYTQKPRDFSALISFAAGLRDKWLVLT